MTETEKLKARVHNLEHMIKRLQEENQRMYSLLSGDEGGMVGDAAKLRNLICRALRGV